MDEIDNKLSLYEEIIDINYEYWIKDEELDVEREAFRLQVDIQYRLKYQVFPVGDIDMEIRMDEICDEVGEELLKQHTEQEEDQELAQLKDNFMNSVEAFLEQKSMLYNQQYPQNRRLKRKDVKLIQRIDFMTNEIDDQTAYEDIFEDMVEEGYFRLVESGGHTKHDIFHVTEV